MANFEFLQEKFPALANYGTLAEKYCYSDPNSCLIKLGKMGESIVNLMYQYDRVEFPYDNKADKRINKLWQEGYIDNELTAMLHALRKVRILQNPDGLNLRDYQVRAIISAENAVVNGRKCVLLAMATGTGKTRTILGMIYRFLKTGRFRRILFLVDRNTLGEQAQDVFRDVKLEKLLTLDGIYNIKGLDEKLIDKETRIQIATVQGMVQRLFYAGIEEPKPAVTDFDLVIVDEAHRGYVLDKTMSEEEAYYRDQFDYQSKYRMVIEYFDSVKIALTATPALHTTQIFGEPAYKYTYRDGVIDGYLIDHDAPHNLKTKLNTEGIHFQKGDVIPVYND